MSTQALTTAEIKARIQTKYGESGAIVLFEVRNTTGYGPEQRSADAVVVETWRSRGYSIIGIEIKASRSDWLRELKNPAKAESIHQFCDKWILVAGHTDIVRPGELPTGWGLLVPHGDGLKSAAVPFDQSPKPVDRGFLCALLRRALQTGLGDPAITAAIALARKEGYEEAGRSQTRDKREHDELRTRVAEFEATAGFRISEGWHGPKTTGEAVKTLIRARDKYDDTAASLRQILKRAEDTAAALRPILADLEPTKDDMENAA